MMSIAQVRSAGSAGNYYTDKDNYYGKRQRSTVLTLIYW